MMIRSRVQVLLGFYGKLTPCQSRRSRSSIFSEENQAASTLDKLREAWLNPPDAGESVLKKRTLTNLYNQRPQWLINAHRELDDAVLDTYGWPYKINDQEILSRLLALNLEREAA